MFYSILRNINILKCLKLSTLNSEKLYNANSFTTQAKDELKEMEINGITRPIIYVYIYIYMMTVFCPRAGPGGDTSATVPRLGTWHEYRWCANVLPVQEIEH